MRLKAALAVARLLNSFHKSADQAGLHAHLLERMRRRYLPTFFLQAAKSSEVLGSVAG